MAHFIGQVSSISELKNVLFEALLNSGWIADGSNIMKKNNIAIQCVASGNALACRMGLGASAGSLITPSPSDFYLYAIVSSEPFLYPIKYNIHLFDKEVFLIVNWSIDKYTYLMFGQSPVSGLPGSGNWLCSTNAVTSTVSGIDYGYNSPYNTINVAYNGSLTTGPFWGRLGGGTPMADTFHIQFNGYEWTSIYGGSADFQNEPDPGVKACNGAGRIMADSQPNAWNNQSILAPVMPNISMASNKCVIIGEIINLRYIRLDNLNPEEIVTLGTDRWKVYPFYKKNAAARNNGYRAPHSGTLGYAVRYDGV